jgi:hypothetical protein
MTPQGKRPDERTPARLGWSTDKQAAAARLADEYIEKMRGIVNDAQNFKPAVGVEAWRTCWERTDEFAANAETIVTSYVVGLWQIFANKSEMERRHKEEWPRFEILLRKLFVRMRQTCIEAGERITDRLPVFRLPSGEILRGPEQVEYEIQRRLREHRLKILRARDEPFRDFDRWRANYVDAADYIDADAGAESRSTLRGPTADDKRHKTIAEAVRPFGDEWRKPKNLERIAKALEREHIRVPKRWQERKVPIISWNRAVKQHPDLVIKVIEYSLKWVRERQRNARNSGKL